MTDTTTETDKKNKNLWVTIGLVLVFIIFILLYIINPWNLNRHISFIGVILTTIGLIVAILQIIKTKNAAEAARDAVHSNIKEVNKYFSYATVSQCEVLIDEIEELINSKKKEQLLLKLKELKDKLIEIQKNPRIWEKKGCPPEVQDGIDKILGSIFSIQESKKQKNEIQYNTIYFDVENIKTKLTELSNDLKYEKL